MEGTGRGRTLHDFFKTPPSIKLDDPSPMKCSLSSPKIEAPPTEIGPSCIN